MTKKQLWNWYNSGDITYSEKERLYEIGVEDYNCHHCNYLQDLKQILFCEDKANSLSEIRNNLSHKGIDKIIFFTPNFNECKPDASNYSCATIIDDNCDNWAISYRPSYVSGIEDDIIVKKVSLYHEVADKLNRNHPILAVAPSYGSFDDFVTLPYVSKKDVYVSGNPDNYLLPLDVIATRGDSYSHFAVYLGNGQICNYLNPNGTVFDN